MVDKKTVLKPKAKAPKAQKLGTSNKTLVNSKVKTQKARKAVREEAKVEPEAIKEVSEAKVPIAAELTVAKAGRRSSKAIQEAEEQQAKEARKTAEAKVETVPKKPVPKPRSRIERAGKKYREVAKLIDKNNVYELAEALELAVKTSTAKFDAAVELHVNLGVDPKMADQNVRDSVTLPAGTGKTLRIAVFAEADDIAKAKTAGADIAGDADLLLLLDKEEIDFDILITSPTLMARLAKYAKLLGPKGLMPNPKSGTITTDIPKAIKDAKAGHIEYRVDQAGIIHLSIGRVSFGAQKLSQNADAVLTSIRAAKPPSLKGIYINSAFITTTMGPSIKVAL